MYNVDSIARISLVNLRVWKALGLFTVRIMNAAGIVAMEH